MLFICEDKKQKATPKYQKINESKIIRDQIYASIVNQIKLPIFITSNP